VISPLQRQTQWEPRHVKRRPVVIAPIGDLLTVGAQTNEYRQTAPLGLAQLPEERGAPRRVVGGDVTVGTRMEASASLLVTSGVAASVAHRASAAGVVFNQR